MRKRLVIAEPGREVVRELLPPDYYEHVVDETADGVVVVISVRVDERKGNDRVLSPAGPRVVKTLEFAPGTVVKIEDAGRR